MREFSVLREISQSMHSLNLEEILQLILKGVTQSIGFDRVRLYLINEKENLLECKMTVGVDQEKASLVTLPLDKKKSLIARVVLEKKAYIIQDADNDPRVNRELKELFNLKSFVAVPLQGKERIMGAISADHVNKEKITKETVDSLIAFSNQAGMAMENARLYQELKLLNEGLEERVKKATDDLRNTQEQLIQSSRLSALGQLAAGVAHEIRNPLTSIRILIHSLKEKLSPEDMRKEDILVIENEIERINQIIKQFLDFARPSKPKMERVNINEVLENTLMLVGYDLSENNIVVEKRLSSVPCILADKDQMKQSFLNIILNALQAMPGGGRLAIRTEQRNTHVAISFQDEGVGIPDAVRKKLFEPFFTTKEEGIGLGLSITRRVVEDHNGIIDMQSAEGKGATFTILLPMSVNELLIKN
jgi:signal transduction histidine kinase